VVLDPPQAVSAIATHNGHVLIYRGGNVWHRRGWHEDRDERRVQHHILTRSCNRSLQPRARMQQAAGEGANELDS